MSVSITTSYAGEFAGKYISAALLSGNTLAAGGIEIKPNVKYRDIIKKLSSGELIANATCDFTTSGSLTTVERWLTPKELQVNLQLCKQTFHNDFEAISMGYSAHDVVPKTFADFMLAHVVEKTAQRIEQSIWSGTDVAGQFQGFTSLLTGPATGVLAGKITVATPVAITSSNVIGELGRIVDAIPATLYGSENLNIYVPQNVAKAYVRALGGFATNLGAAGVDNKGTQWFTNGALTFDGVKIFVANGLASNIVIATEKDNLFFGTGLLSDQNEATILDMATLDGSQNFRVILRFTAGVQFGNAEDIVVYGIAAV